MASISSPASTTQTATIAATDWWLKDPLDSSRNMQLGVYGKEYFRKRPVDQAFYSPLGRSKRVSVRDVVRGEEISLNHVIVLSEAERDKLELLCNSGRILLLQTWEDEQFYVVPDGALARTRYNTSTPYYEFDMSFIEVDAP